MFTALREAARLYWETFRQGWELHRKARRK